MFFLRSSFFLLPFFHRWIKFSAVGAGGIVVQTVSLALLVRVAGMHYLAATALAVEASVLHNFAWHHRWTWGDRKRSRVALTLARFNLTAGALSIGGNLALMWLLVGGAGIRAQLANLVTIAICSMVNFALCDRLVFVSGLEVSRNQARVPDSPA